MKRRTKLAVGAGTALAVIGTGAAIGATKLTPREESKAVLDDAAKQLGVDPAKLSDALEQALANRIDAAVKAGTLTKERGDELKAAIAAGTFPLFGVRGGPGGGHRGGGFGNHLEAAATYLGITEDALRTQLRDGKTFADVAKAQSKSVDGLVAALVADETKELDAAVAAGKLTKAQRDARVSGLKERITARVNGERPEGKRGHGFGQQGFGRHGPGRHGFGPPPGDASFGFRGEDEPPAAA